MNKAESTTSRVFDCPPTVELLQILARGPLKQNLPKAVRLWVILRSLYGDEADPVRVDLGDRFTYSDWCQRFFTQPDYHKDDKIPIQHDSQCPCAKTLSDWLFAENGDANDRQWKQSFLNNLLDFGVLFAERENLRLFAQTRKNFQNDFQALIAMGWLRVGKLQAASRTNQYQKVSTFPLSAFLSPPDVSNNVEVLNVIRSDLADFFDDFALEINGTQRFFLEIEYIVPSQLSQWLNSLRRQLKELWQRTPIPPIKITYVSAKKFQSRQEEGDRYIVYPVCIYYAHRAPYLFAYGQTPAEKNGRIDWYDYRLDRIQKLEVLEWSQINLPDFSLPICKPKTPKLIEQLKSEAFGFDFYKPKKLLLVRFESYFHSHYVEGTEREELFKQIPYKQAQRLIENSAIAFAQIQQLLEVLKSRSKDVYCRLYYRQGDYNAIMRLRAWGPKVEVLLPWELRETMAKESLETCKLYNFKQGQRT